MEAQSILGWVFGGVATVVATLAGAVATLYKAAETKNTKAIGVLQDRADECEHDREELRVELAGVKAELQLLRRKTGQDN